MEFSYLQEQQVTLPKNPHYLYLRLRTCPTGGAIFNFFASWGTYVAMFGQKRLSREGGVEIVVKELCTRMAQNGCDVTCYNRAGHHVSGAEYDDAGKTEYEGIRQKSVPTIERRGARDIIGSTKKNYDN